jgi:hypothetical protein
MHSFSSMHDFTMEAAALIKITSTDDERESKSDEINWAVTGTAPLVAGDEWKNKAQTTRVKDEKATKLSNSF